MEIQFKYNYPQMARESGFKLRQFKDGELDWRLMGSFEIERILRDQNLEQIDGVLTHLSEAPLSSILETNILESGIAKYFLISQFAIQYLLFCRTFLDESVHELRESYAKSESEVARLKQTSDEANKEILQLHRRITQMEAIHEVIYPCALCTKNFISNDALNLHMGRKHPQAVTSSTKQYPTQRGHGDESLPLSGQRERDYNLSLINTIKMEVEIKQLKERLNVAEQEIKERAALPQQVNAPDPVSITPKEVRSLKDVGIQNNLCEEKELNASRLDDENDSIITIELNERKMQLAKLQDQVEDFEQWKQRQITNSDASLAEINRKLNELTLALEAARGERESIALGKGAMEVQRNASPSVQDLERLEQKVSEMSASLADKLEEVAHQLEASYKNKLDEMELTLKQRLLKEDERLMVAGTKENQPSPKRRNEEGGHKPKGITRGTPTLPHETYDAIVTNDTEDQKRNPRATEVVVFVKDRRSDEELSMRSTASNHTYVKSKQSRAANHNLRKTASKFSAQTYDLTEASQSLSEDTNSDAPKEKADDAVELQPKLCATPAEKKLHTISGNVQIQKDTAAKISRAKTQPVAKPKYELTIKDAKKVANKRLASVGCDPNAKSLSFSAMRRISYVLTENRNHLKQQYPQFYTTRNRIKKLVDKLCSTKLPESAEFMLKATQVLQPPVPAAAPRRAPQKSETISTAENIQIDTGDAETALRPSSINENDSFKHRLESILGTPPRMLQPINDLQPNTNAPRPVPRKRVMFNTLQSSIAEHNSDQEKHKPRTEISYFA